MFFVIKYYYSLSIPCADLFLKPIRDNRRDPTALIITTGVN